jgi:hypothetical protein
MKKIEIISSPARPGPTYTQVSEEFVEWLAESYKVSEMINSPIVTTLVKEMEQEVENKRNNQSKSELG